MNIEKLLKDNGINIVEGKVRKSDVEKAVSVIAAKARVSEVAYVIVGTDEKGRTVYYRKWSGSSSSGRPTWTTKFSGLCLYMEKDKADSIVSDKNEMNEIYNRRGVEHHDYGATVITVRIQG